VTSRTHMLSSEATSRVDAMLARYRSRVTDGLRDALDSAGVEHTDLMRAHLGIDEPAEAGGLRGKLLRPSFCLLCCDAVGGDPARAMAGAVALS